MISSLLNVAYLFPIVIRGFFSAPDDQLDQADNQEAHPPPPAVSAGDAGGANQWKVGGWEEAPVLCVGALVATALGCILLFFYADALYHFLAPLADGVL